MTNSTITREQTEALAKLAEIPAVGSEERRTGATLTGQATQQSPSPSVSALTGECPSRDLADTAREAFERHYRHGFTLTRAEWGDGYFYDGIDAMWKGWSACWRERDKGSTASAAAIPSGGWRPIETAPRDGTKFDAWAVHPASSTMGVRFTDVQMRGDGTGFGVVIHRPQAHWEYLEQDGAIYPAWRLTHWRPRPDGPASCDDHSHGEDQAEGRGGDRTRDLATGLEPACAPEGHAQHLPAPKPSIPQQSTARTDSVQWRPMTTAPHGQPIVAKHKPNDRMLHGWVATIKLGHGDDEEEGCLDTILHYNGDATFRGFHGVWTGWLPLEALAGDTRSAETCKGSVEDEHAADLSATPSLPSPDPLTAAQAVLEEKP